MLYAHELYAFLLYSRLLGVDKLFSYAISEWLNDIKKNQLPGILGGVGPIHSLVQLGEIMKIGSHIIKCTFQETILQTHEMHKP